MALPVDNPGAGAVETNAVPFDVNTLPDRPAAVTPVPPFVTAKVPDTLAIEILTPAILPLASKLLAKLAKLREMVMSYLLSLFIFLLLLVMRLI